MYICLWLIVPMNSGLGPVTLCNLNFTCIFSLKYKNFIQIQPTKMKRNNIACNIYNE